MALSDWNRGVIEEFRGSGRRRAGRWGERLLLLTVRGRRTGEGRTYPLAFHKDGERYVVAATKGGAPTNPDWYRNLVVHRDVVVEAEGGEFRARAIPVPGGPERDRLWEAHATLMPGFRGYEGRTTRVIPMIVLERI